MTLVSLFFSMHALQPPREKRTRTVDVLFIVDATSSMSRAISTVKDRIKDIAQDVDQAEQYQLRAGLVAYRCVLSWI